MDITTIVLEWLEDQLDTATEQGGNFISKWNQPDIQVEDVDVEDESSLKVRLTDGQRVIISIREA